MALEITPDAPCPSTFCKLKLEEGSEGTVATLRVERLNGLPENANHASLGKFNNCSGHSVKLFAEIRTNSRLFALANVNGSLVSLLPANASFCNLGRSPNVSGKVSITLSVKINQRSFSGSELAGT